MTSTRKGNPKKEGQKYQNTQAFSVSKRHILTQQQTSVKSTEVSGLCKRCTEVIKWKIKYGKYKALSVPKRCVLCGMKTVNRAYFSVCKQCAMERGCCGKCQCSDAIGAFPDTADVKARELNYLREEMKHMKERERRKLIRDMNKDSKSATANQDTKVSQWNADTSDSASESDNEALDLDIVSLGESSKPEDRGIGREEGLDDC